MHKDQGIELAMLLTGLAIYGGYHLWLFWLRGYLRSRFNRKAQHVGVFETSSDARLVWTYITSQDPTDAAVPAVQTLRNSIMAASFMATTCGLMATSGLLPVLTDVSRLKQIAALGDLDPVVGASGSSGLVTAPWKIGIALLLLLLSLLLFLQNIRLLTHLGYFVKIRAAGEPWATAFSAELTLAISRRAGHCWTAGVRVWCLFIPVLLWIFGPLTFLVTSILTTLFLSVTDEVRIRDFPAIIGADKREPDASSGGASANGGKDVEEGVKQGGERASGAFSTLRQRNEQPKNGDSNEAEPIG